MDGPVAQLPSASVKAQHTCSVCGAYVGPELVGDYHVHASADPAAAPTTVVAAATAQAAKLAAAPPGPAPERLPVV